MPFNKLGFATRGPAGRVDPMRSCKADVFSLGALMSWGSPRSSILKKRAPPGGLGIIIDLYKGFS